MLEFSIPGFKELHLEHVVLDYNGTLAVEGYLIEGVKQRLNILAERCRLHIITGDSYGHAKDELKDVNCKIIILAATGQATAKKDYVYSLGSENVVAIGNGRNDALMLKEAGIGIAVIGAEGLAKDALLAADLMMPDIFSVFDTLQHARRLKATLRS